VRLSRLETQFRFVDRLKLALMRVMSGRTAPDVVKLHFYRRDLLGKPLGALFQDALRGPSEWSVYERETMAAFVSSLNQCVF
jgi:hypothetical protein